MSFQPRSVGRKNKSNSSKSATPIDTTSNTERINTTSIETDTKPTTSSLPFLVPRSLSKGKKVSPRVNPTISNQVAIKVEDVEPIASTSTLLESVKLDSNESNRLELILSTLELCMSDLELSTHRSSGILDKLRDSEDGYIHLQFILQRTPPITALTKVQFDLQKALRSRVSRSLQLSPTGFHVRRIHPPNFAELSELNPEDWQNMTMYLENLPSIPSTIQTSHTLQDHLSNLLSTTVQKVILPPLSDPSQSNSSHSTAHNTSSTSKTQDEAFSSGKRKPKALDLPLGGGTFKGFAFVVVAKKEDAEAALKRWAWNREDRVKINSERKGKEVADGKGDSKMEISKIESDYEKLAIESGLRILSYSGYVDLKTEYLEYQKSLQSLQSHSEIRNSSNSTWKNDHPSSSNAHQSSHQIDSHLSSNRKRDRQDSTIDHSSSAHKKSRRASSPSLSRSKLEHNKRQRSVTPDYESGDDISADVVGAFPKGCVLWLRNVFEKSTRGSLKSMIGAVLENLEEGSGTGIIYVDYEKGMDTCHARFSSPHLTNLIKNHLTDTPQYHLTPSILGDAPTTLTPDLKPITVQLLEKERERLYWEGLPESARKEARKWGGVPVAVVAVSNKKQRKEIGDVLLELEKKDLEKEKKAAEVVEKKPVLLDEVSIVEKPRKKASKF